MARSKRVEVEVDGRTISLSNLEELVYPEAGFTKGHVVDYYTRIAPVLLPHLAGRPLTLKRYPNGVGGQPFYEKQAPKHRPEWVETVTMEVHGSTKGRSQIDFVVCGDLPTLVWLAQLRDLELHPLMSRAPDLERPTAVVFDLDPGPPAGLAECGQVALTLRDLLDGIGLRCYAKTSGSKGMQVYVPLNSAQASYEQTRPFAHTTAETLQRALPDLVVTEMKRALRPGKVFIDWSQNARHKTTISVYSLRGKPQPTVSTPVSWEEIPVDRQFSAPEVLERVAEHGDLFADVLACEQELPGSA